MERKEGNISTARELYQKALSINSTTESAARCLQQRAGNLSAARRLFTSSLNTNSQSYVTWMTWENLEEDQGNSVRAEDFQQRTEVVDDESWIMGFLDVIDPAIDRIKRLLNLDQNSYYKVKESTSNTIPGDDVEGKTEESAAPSSANINDNNIDTGSGFDLDDFIRVMLSLDPSKLEV